MKRYKLKLLGGFSLTDADSEVIGLRAKKARAVFIYMAAHGVRAVVRDRLSFLLWGNSSESQARHSLRQALADIRKAVGGDNELILSDGEEVRLNPELISVDVLAFEKLIKSTEPASAEQAVDLYQGDLVEGFFSREDAFDDWLDSERQRLKMRALELMTHCLDRLPASRTEQYRFGLARRILTIDPLEENAQCRIIEYFAAQRQPHLAIRQFERYRDSLRKDFGIEPGSQIIDTIERMRDQTARPGTIDIASTVSTEAVYKNLTVLSLYVCGLNQAEQENAEHFSNRLEKIQSLISSIVEAHRGQVSGMLANQIIAVFDTGQINYNIDLAALQAAIECRQAVLQDFETDLKAALTSGQLVLQSTYREQALASPVVIEAIEMLQRGQSGDILLSPEVRDQCQGYAGFSLVDNDGGAVYRLDLVASHAAAYQDEFIGRRMECAQFAAALELQAQWQSGQVILVRGEVGIGKSMLVRQFNMLAQQDGLDIDWWSFELTPATRSISDLLGKILETLVAEANLDPSALTLEQMIGFCTSHKLDASNAEDLLALLQQKTAIGATVDKIEDRQRVQLQSVFFLVQTVVDEKPLCLSIEDIHLAESGLMDAIAELANMTVGRPLLLLISARSDGEPLDPAWRGQFLTAQLTLMELNLFSQPEAQLLAAGFTHLSQDLRARCLQRAQGHPLFLEQLLSHADEESDVLPDSIRKSIQHHLDRLDIKLQHAAQILALAGLDFDPPLLEFLQINQTSLDSLLKEQILVRHDDRLGFCHQLLHEVVLHNTLPSRRLALHQKLAKYYKLRDAHRHAEHLIQTDAENRAKVMLDAIDEQLASGRYEEAMRLLDLTQSLLDTESFRPFGLSRVKVLQRLGHNVRALQLCDEHLASCEYETECCRFYIEKGRIELLLERLDDAGASLQRALDLAVQFVLGDLTAEIHLLLGNTAFSANRLQQCLQQHRQALDLAQAQDNDELSSQALGGLGDAYYSLGRMVTAAGFYRQAVELDLPGSIQAGNRAMFAYCQVFMLEMQAAEQNTQASIRQAERLYDLRGEALARNIECIRLIESGDNSAAITQGEAALVIAEKLGSTRFILDNLTQLGHAFLRLGEVEKARQRLQQAWQICQQGLNGFMGATVAGYLALSAKDSEQQYWLEQGERLLTGGALSHNYLNFYHSAIELGLINGNADRARYYADKLKLYTSEESLPWADEAIARV